IGLAGYLLVLFPLPVVVGVVGVVICVDTFAYFFGRTLGGPKIAPAISPSKTWAGLLGGIVGATVWIAAWLQLGPHALPNDFAGSIEDIGAAMILGVGALTAVAAQAGDFLESWLKRKAGVKDSSKLIPGHGGVFDRTDGMIPVVLLAGALLAGVR
ncbi:MAG: phosphatidate cytidylyltransferase, partial [Pseudomonadota bacterium]|nr:phosphatidate cytidylyltransferase [Pseudomonadota bacterium]